MRRVREKLPCVLDSFWTTPTLSRPPWIRFPSLAVTEFEIASHVRTYATPAFIFERGEVWFGFRFYVTSFRICANPGTNPRDC
ncbi:hypothetical protein TNCV_2880031 [Trichonephila clavipes]|uniref:Uncharacterized protein n=1 Tax=Trichonephila clavipes TaxID=2585209 RepID=A0A8X6W1T2_TRICX|nr:hypothetical protein TNCV_2880031 [Trichonephila clavipes]